MLTWPTHAALGAVLGLYLVVRSSVLGSVIHLDIAAYIAVVPTTLRITTGIANLAEVARLLLFPLDLSPEYGPAVITPAGLTDPRFWSGAATLAVAAGLAFCGWRSGRGGRWITLGVG